APLAAARHQQHLGITGQIAELLLGVRITHHGTNGYGYIEIGTAASGAVVGASGLTVPGLERALDAKVRKRVDARSRTQIHAAAVAAIAAVGATERDELLAAEARAAAATVAGLDAHFRFVDEFHGVTLNKKPRRWPGFSVRSCEFSAEPCGGACSGLFGED